MTKFLKNADVTGYISQTLVTSSLLKTDSSGKLVAATAGTDYQAPTAALLPTGGTAGQILAKIDATNYNTQWIDNFAQQLKHDVKLGATLAKGKAVYVSSANGTNMIVSAADNSTEATSSKTLGLLETGGVTNDIVKVITEGLLAGLDTSTATAGDPVWLGTNGDLIFGLANKPVAPAHLVFIGIVTRVQSVNGEIFVKVQNGFELNEIHNVLLSSTANNDGLFYESSSGLWKNKSIATVLGYTPADAATYVPYTGATSNVNLGFYELTTSAVTVTGAGSGGAGVVNLAKASSRTVAGLGYVSLFSDTNIFGFLDWQTSNTRTAQFSLASLSNNTIRTYTLPNANGTLALTSDLSSYLPLTGGTLTGALVINPANSSTVGLDLASNTFRLRTDSSQPFPRQLTTTIGSGTLVKMQAAGYGATYVTDLGFYTSSGSAVNTTPNLYLTGGNNRVGINTDTPAYTLDVSGTIGASGAITANSFVKSGGSSLQFLMADGSVSLGATATARTEQIFTATAGQTTFTVTGGYVVGLVDVYVNGVKLLPSDFTATNGSTVVLGTGAVLNDSVTIINYTATIAALPTSRDVIDYTATSAQTTFTVTGGYVVGLLDVYVNGVKLTSSEYTATNGTTFVLAVASVTGDQVQAIRYNASITGVSGSGTANYLPKFTASQTLGNSLIQDDGTTVTIGSTDSNLLMPRAATSNNATVNFATGGTTRWNVGLRGLYSADDFYIFNPVLGINYITLSAASSLANFGVSIRAQTFTSYIASGIFLNNSSGGTSAVQMRINNTGGDFRAGIESSTGGTIQLNTSAYAAVFGNQANYATQFTTNGTVRMTIDNSGLVGIGTTSPNGKLTSYGNEIGLQLTFTKDAPSGAYGRLGQDSNGTFLTQNAKYDGSSWTRDNTGGVPMALALHNGNGRYEFRIAANGTNPISWTNALVIESNAAATFASSVTATQGIFSQAMTNGSTSAFTNPNLALKATNATDTTGFIGMTFATSDANNYGFSYGALRSSGGLGDLVWRNHFNSAQGTELMRLTYNGILQLQQYAEIGRGISSTQYTVLSENQLYRTGGGSLYINNSGSGAIIMSGGGGNVLINKTNNTGDKLQVSDGTNMYNFSYDANGPYLSCVNNANTVYKRLSFDSNDAVFYGSGTERIRITNAGVLNFNGDSTETSVSDKLSMGYSNGSRGWIQTWGGTPLYFNRLGNAVYAGTARIDNNSDARVKDNVQSITGALSKVLSMNGKKFHMLDEPEDKIRLGFIAQELQGVVDELVIESDRTQTLPNGEVIENILGLETWGSSWAALLVEAIKELKAELDLLKNN